MDIKYKKEHINMNNFKDIISYFLMIPAILIGTLTMESYGVTSSIWLNKNK
jgi:hypothetical protein